MVEEEDCIKDISGNMKKSNKKIRNATICRNSNLKKMVATLKNGKQINVLAKVNFYEVKGEIQLNIEDIFLL